MPNEKPQKREGLDHNAIRTALFFITAYYLLSKRYNASLAELLFVDGYPAIVPMMRNTLTATLLWRFASGESPLDSAYGAAVTSSVFWGTGLREMLRPRN
jgi:hypothetical protein